MSVEDDIDSDNEHKSDDEEYESVALNAPFNDDHYDEDIDILEEMKELKKIKGKNCFSIFKNYNMKFKNVV